MTSDLWNPAQYQKFKDQRSKPFFDLCAMIRKQKFSFAVDLGCGTGELTKSLHETQSIGETLGLDSSENMLNRARTLEGDGLRFAHQGIEDFVPEKPVDLLFSNAALQWVGDHDTLFPRLLATVAPGGQVAIQMPFNYSHPSHALAQDTAEKLFPKSFPKEERRARVREIDFYARMFHNCGFTEQDCLIRVYGHPMASGRDVVEWTKGTLLTDYQRRLTPSQFDEFLEKYREILLGVIGEGPYFYPFRRMLLWARKAT